LATLFLLPKTCAENCTVPAQRNVQEETPLHWNTDWNSGIKHKQTYRMAQDDVPNDVLSRGVVLKEEVGDARHSIMWNVNKNCSNISFHAKR